MACHLRVMKETARIGQTESNLGIIPGFGGTQRLPRLIGRTKALEFLILGTQMTAPDALALGLVNRLSKEGETLSDARALAATIARRAPIATRLIIECVDRGLDGPIDAGTDADPCLSKTLQTEDAAGVQRSLKRPPESKDGRRADAGGVPSPVVPVEERTRSGDVRRCRAASGRSAQGLKAVIRYDITGQRAARTTSTSRTGGCVREAERAANRR